MRRAHGSARPAHAPCCDVIPQGLRYLVRAAAWLADPEPLSTPHSMHLLPDGCAFAVIWSAVFETASLAFNGVW